MVLTLVLVPIVASFFLLVGTNKAVQLFITSTVLILLSAISFSLYLSADILNFQFTKNLNHLIIAADILLLLFFLYQGKKFNNPKVMGLSAVQLVLYAYIESIAPEAGSAEIVVDYLSRFMFLIINVVGGVIVLYSVHYMEDEPGAPLKIGQVIAGLHIFLTELN